MCGASDEIAIPLGTGLSWEELDGWDAVAVADFRSSPESLD
jgi:hypothetical protein